MKKRENATKPVRSKKETAGVKRSDSSVKSTKPAPTSSPLFPAADVAFKALLSARFCAAIWSNISDCDETFNYWEPLHYLLNGKGLQTWEYSPEFALRSYTYLMIHGAPAWIYQQVLTPNPVLIFYFIRCLLGFGCAVSEVYFYKGVCREFGVHIGRAWLIFQLFSAGMFISSAAFLPSSFSMYLSMAALSAWWHQKYKLAIFFTAISTLLGWPFAIILGVPIVFDIVLRLKKIRLFVFWSIISGVTILLPMIILDSSYFGKLVLAPVNIVLYNVFTSHGPNLYGTEPHIFYLINGFLNFNVIWLLALASPLAIAFCWLLVPAKSKSTLTLPYYLSLAPFFLWLAVFSLQPHKEERFLFPIYPMISLCGAITMDIIQKIYFRIKSFFLKLPSYTHYLNHSTFLMVICVVVMTIFNVFRILALYHSYHAPLDIAMELQVQDENLKLKEVNVCFGKDWYRFPSSFSLPSTKYSVRFVKSEFNGILPAYYADGGNSTQIAHPYFNDLNQANDFMLFDLDLCHYLVDLDLKSDAFTTELEPNYSAQTSKWKIIKSLPFLNTHESHRLLRAFFVPFLTNSYVTYGNLNLLQRIAGEATN